jgi:alpha-methylacyl-CoA racemase
MPRTGPLTDVTVIELAGMGPGPFAGMTLADMGADVVRVERPGGYGLFPGTPEQDVLNRGKRAVALDLKQPAAVETVLRMVERADVLIEGYRPGVAERLGLGPEHCAARNPGLVYGRMTGWGQEGPLSMTAGHDVSYIAITGALHGIGTPETPALPLNLLGDYGGGGTYLVSGVLAALLEARRTGRGQVVDAAIVDGVAHLLAGIHAMLNAGSWRDERGVNMLDGAAPYYNVYRTADGRHMAVGAIEPKFYRELLAVLKVEDLDPERQDDAGTWAATRERLAAAFAEGTLAEWEARFEGSDACAAPVLGLAEAADHPHLRARGALRHTDGVLQPGPAPRFPAHPVAEPGPPPATAQHTREVLAQFGIDPEPLLATGAAVQA